MLSDIYFKFKFECLELKIVGHRDITLNCQSYPHTQVFLVESDQNPHALKKTLFLIIRIEVSSLTIPSISTYSRYIPVNTCSTGERMHNKISECLEMIK